MKIYNVDDTKKFFEMLSRCSKDVEVVNGEGLHISLKEEGGNDQLGLLAAAYLRGNIREMELCFVDPEDVKIVCDYLAGMKAS